MKPKTSAEQEASGAVGRLGELIKTMQAFWQRSVNEQTTGVIDIYVVDADVVLMFMAPAKMNNYGALLRYDRVARDTPDEVLHQLERETVEFLGNLLFFHLDPGVPVALLHPHAAELEGQLERIGDEAFAEHSTLMHLQRALQDTAIKVYDTSTEELRSAGALAGSQGSAAAPRIAELLERIFSSLHGEGAAGPLFRFNTLVDAERLVHVDRLELRDEDGESAFLPSAITVDGHIMPALLPLEKRLLERLATLDHIQTDARRLARQHDATALAYLAWLNDWLADHPHFIGTGQTRRRVGKLVLVTGSQLIPRAVESLGLTSLQAVIFAPLSLLGHRSMDGYVHGAMGVPEGQHTMESSLVINFLDSMQESLSRAIDGGSLHVISHALDQARKDHLKLIESWKGKQLLTGHSVSREVAEAIAALRAGTGELDELFGVVQEASVKSWQKFARSVAFLNYKNLPLRSVQRNIPPIEFKSDAAGLQYRRLRDNTSVSESDSNGPLHIHTLREEDKTHYTEFMFYSLWAIGHRMWRSAQGCVEQAIAIAEEGGDERVAERIEALFLRAHLAKLCADSPQDLIHAAQCIEQIRELNVDGGGNALRFVAEGFSIRCHRCYFTVFRKEPRRLRGSVLLQAFHEGEALADRLPHGQADYTSEYIRQQILGNLIMIALLGKFGHAEAADGTMRVYAWTEPSAELAEMESRVRSYVDALIAVCQSLQAAPSGAPLPRASILSLAVAAAGAEVWLGGRNLDNWFDCRSEHWTATDRQRFRYLHAVHLRA